MGNERKQIDGNENSGKENNSGENRTRRLDGGKMFSTEGLRVKNTNIKEMIRKASHKP